MSRQHSTVTQSDKQDKSAIAVLAREGLRDFCCLPPTQLEGYTMICNPTGLKIQSNSDGVDSMGRQTKSNSKVLDLVLSEDSLSLP